MENIIDYNQISPKSLQLIQAYDGILIRIQKNTSDRHGFLAVFGEETLSTQVDKSSRGEKQILAQF